MSQDNFSEQNHEFDDEFLEWEERDEEVPFLSHCIAGSIAGVTEHVMILPFDTIKTNMQVADGKYSTFETAKKLYKTEGFRKFWGAAPILASGCVPAHAVYFSIYELAKAKFLPKFHDQNTKVYPYIYALTGIMATSMHDLILTPFDMLKQRAQIATSEFRNMKTLLTYVIKNEGLVSLYRGYPVTLFMNVPQAAAIVSVNETLKVLYRPKNGHNVFSYFICAGIAGSVAALATIPLDNIKTRLQTQTFLNDSRKLEEKIKRNTFNKAKNNQVQPNQIRAAITQMIGAQRSLFVTIKETKYVGEKDIKYHDIISTIKTILREEGVKGFVKGAIPRIMTQAPASAISWTTYEMIKKFLISSKQH